MPLLGPLCPLLNKAGAAAELGLGAGSCAQTLTVLSALLLPPGL